MCASGGKAHVAQTARLARLRLPDFSVHAVEYRAHFRVKHLRQAIALPARGTVAGFAVFQVQQQHGIAGQRPELVDFQGRKLGPEIHVRVHGFVEVLEVIDDRAAIELRKNSVEPKPECPTTKSGWMSGRAFKAS